MPLGRAVAIDRTLASDPAIRWSRTTRHGIYRYNVDVERRKTSLNINERLLRSVKIIAASEGRKEYEIVEAALAAYVGRHAVEHNWQRSDAPTESEAMDLARAALAEAEDRSRTMAI